MIKLMFTGLLLANVIMPINLMLINKENKPKSNCHMFLGFICLPIESDTQKYTVKVMNIDDCALNGGTIMSTVSSDGEKVRCRVKK